MNVAVGFGADVEAGIGTKVAVAIGVGVKVGIGVGLFDTGVPDREFTSGVDVDVALDRAVVTGRASSPQDESRMGEDKTNKKPNRMARRPRRCIGTEDSRQSSCRRQWVRLQVLLLQSLGIRNEARTKTCSTLRSLVVYSSDWFHGMNEVPELNT